MSDVIIRAADLTKVYRLYSKPHYRFLDMFGLLAGVDARYTEHRALDGVNLEIRRGEKVAIIGRNGAGKSTLLKLATKVIEPTSGRIEVAEGIHALLQIGSGFHPEFSGRENARSYLAHLGISGNETDEKIREIVEFAELEEYIDQPIKTYSTGMAARLMFATSTAVAPKLLVLDEILGVGDAYFAQKSYERIKELCDTQGSTVLLVSHDVYSAAKLCERMIWVDQGRIMIDSASPTVMKAYEDSIRAQEDARLLKKSRLRLAALAKTFSGLHFLRLEIYSPQNLPLPTPVRFYEICCETALGDFRIPLATETAVNWHASHIQMEDGCWGPPATYNGRAYRPMNNFGSPFRRAVAVFALPFGIETLRADAARIILIYESDARCVLRARLYFDEQTIELEDLRPSDKECVRHSIDLQTYLKNGGAPSLADAVNIEGIHGTGNALVVGLRVLDHTGNESLRVEHGRAMTLEIDYEVRQPDLCEAADLLVALHRDGVHDVCRFFTNSVVLDAANRPRGTISMHVPRLPVPNGNYTISLTLAKAGYYAKNPTAFYSINPDVHTCLSRFLEIQVFGGDPIASGMGLVEQASWSNRGR